MKNFILKTITTIMVIILLFGIMTLDTPDTNVPAFMCLVAFAWLFPFCYANNWFEKDGEIDE